MTGALLVPSKYFEWWISDLEKEACGGDLVINERGMTFRGGITRGNWVEINSKSRRKGRGVARGVSQPGIERGD